MMGKGFGKRIWVILDYKNGNKSIMERTQYEKEVGKLSDYDEAVVGIVEAEHGLDWDDFEYDEETREYVLREDLDKE